jgi:hypothetical protein
VEEYKQAKSPVSGLGTSIPCVGSLISCLIVFIDFVQWGRSWGRFRHSSPSRGNEAALQGMRGL